MSLRNQLKAFDIEDGDVSLDSLEEAIEWAEEQEALIHQPVLTVYRESFSPMGGDEIEETGYIFDVVSGEVCFYWRENAGGMAFAGFSSGPVQGIGDWLAELMKQLGFTFNQFVNCTLTNHAPQALSRDTMYRIVEEALARGEADEEERPLPDWFADEYKE
jgi:hypothetical protein